MGLLICHFQERQYILATPIVSLSQGRIKHSYDLFHFIETTTRHVYGTIIWHVFGKPIGHVRTEHANVMIIS